MPQAKDVDLSKYPISPEHRFSRTLLGVSADSPWQYRCVICEATFPSDTPEAVLDAHRALPTGG